MEFYNFKELEPKILGNYYISGYFSFTTLSHNSPREGDIVRLIDGATYKVTSVVDCTSDEEKEQGLSFDKIYLTLI